MPKTLQDYKRRPQYGTYAFCVKTYNFHVPHWVQENTDDDGISADIDRLVEDLFENMRQEFKSTYAWITSVSLEGRSAGWVVVHEDESPDEREEAQRLEDLEWMAREIELVRRDCVHQIESGELWQDTDAPEPEPDYKALLRDVVDSYDDTGCEDCGVVDAGVYAAAHKAIYGDDS